MHRAKILLVDDNKVVRETLREGLEMIALQVVDAVDYEGAVQLLDSSIDLALVDIVLEGKSGLEILSYIHRQYPKIPVIMISGHASKSNAIEALHKGAADYLEKPIRIQELKHVVDRWLLFRALQAENTSLRKEKQLQDELREQMQKLERFNKAAVGREMRMIELKKEMNALLAEMGREEKYIIHEVKGY